MSIDPIKPYAALIKLGLVVVFELALVVVALVAGYQWAQSAHAEAVAAKDKRIGSLEKSLGDFVALYDRVNAESKRQLEFAEAQRKAAAEAEVVARQAEAAARREADAFEAKWNDAKQRKPQCAALLASNMEAVCGLKLR